MPELPGLDSLKQLPVEQLVALIVQQLAGDSTAVSSGSSPKTK